MAVEFDYSKLLGRIKERYGTQANYAMALELGRVSVNQRLNNRAEFTGQEIIKSCQLLGIAQSDIPAYFFTEKVQKHEQTITNR